MSLFELKQQFSIESARFLPNLPKEHPCTHTHGHSFHITLICVGELDPKLGWVMDYNDIMSVCKPVIAKVDHRLLNEVEGLTNPTTEILCQWFFNQLKKDLPILKQVVIAETTTSSCAYPA